MALYCRSWPQKVHVWTFSHEGRLTERMSKTEEKSVSEYKYVCKERQHWEHSEIVRNHVFLSPGKVFFAEVEISPHSQVQDTNDKAGEESPTYLLQLGV